MRVLHGIPLCLTLLMSSLTACAAQPELPDENCLEITLTGTQGGPPQINGLAGAGTLVRYGSTRNQCSDVLLQFDAGRGTTGRLSQAGVSVKQLSAVFLTHLHSDHSEGLIDLLQLRWHFLGKPLDVVCSDDVTTDKPPPERVLSCRNYLAHIGDAMLHSGEITQRYAENKKRDPAGPVAIVNAQIIPLPLPVKPGKVVWQSGEVSVRAVKSAHIAGHLSYRVDTPAGSVVIGGDAGNAQAADSREYSTSPSVEALAQGADVLVHSAMHPVFAPGNGSHFPPVAYNRQSTVGDLAAMARRAGIKHLVLTHLIPALGTESHGPFRIPTGPLQAEDFATAVKAGGFTGKISVGTDLLTIRLP